MSLDSLNPHPPVVLLRRIIVLFEMALFTTRRAGSASPCLGLLHMSSPDESPTFIKDSNGSPLEEIPCRVSKFNQTGRWTPVTIVIRSDWTEPGGVWVGRWVY